MGFVFSMIGDWFTNAVRTLFSMIDGVLYSLLSFLYQIFFNIASATVVSGDTIYLLFTRIQLILGVIIVFRLALILLDGIVNPEKITDNKSGAGKLVTRIVIALILLILIIPLNIPSSDIEEGDYNSQLNTNGVLFGTLYEFQNRVLKENTIARLILGSKESMENMASEKTMTDAGRELSVLILKSFITVNMKEDMDGEDPRIAANRICDSDDSDVQELVEDYLDNTTNIYQILNNINADCKSDGKKVYVFNYMILISTASIILVLIIMLGFTIDVGMRVFKMSILRLVAPVPIINYIDPKSGDRALEAWSKAVSKTYLDIFCRVAVIFFILFVIREFSNNGVVFSVNRGAVYGLSYVILIIALFYFAREAPKFILESMGFKYDGGYFSGISKMFGALGTAVNTPGSIRSAYRSRRDELARASELDPSFLNTNRGAVIARSLVSGLVRGGVGGVGTGLMAASGARDHHGRAARQAIQQRNALMFAQADAGSTFGGRLGSGFSRSLLGESPAETLKREIANDEAKIKALDAINNRVKGEMVKKNWTTANVTDTAGNSYNNVNYKRFMAQLAQAKAEGSASFMVQDASGHDIRSISITEAEMLKGDIELQNQDSYIRSVVSGAQRDLELSALIQDAEAKKANGGNPITERSHYKLAQERLTVDVMEKRRLNVVNEQNDRFAQMNQNR